MQSYTNYLVWQGFAILFLVRHCVIFQELCTFAVMKRIFFFVLSCFLLVEQSLSAQQLDSVECNVPIDSVRVDELWENDSMDVIIIDGVVVPPAIGSVFVNLKVSELSLLSENNRLDLLDYANCGMAARVENCYGGKTELTLKTEDYMHLSMTSVSELDILFLSDITGDTIVGMISTITSPIEQSIFHAYTLTGEQIALTFPIPASREFVCSNIVEESILSKIDMLPVRIKYICEDKTFECQLSTKRLSREESAIITKNLKTIRYKWDGVGFVRE